MKKFLMKILSDESRILRLGLNLWYGVVKISSWGSDNKIERLDVSKIKKSRSSDDTKAGFPQWLL